VGGERGAADLIATHHGYATEAALWCASLFRLWRAAAGAYGGRGGGVRRGRGSCKQARQDSDLSFARKQPRHQPPSKDAKTTHIRRWNVVCLRSEGRHTAAAQETAPPAQAPVPSPLHTESVRWAKQAHLLPLNVDLQDRARVEAQTRPRGDQVTQPSFRCNAQNQVRGREEPLLLCQTKVKTRRGGSGDEG